jgi:hypothetical protein
MKIERVAVLAKFEDGGVRQIIISPEQETAVLNAIIKLEEKGTIRVIEEPLQGIDLEIYSEIKSNKKS